MIAHESTLPYDAILLLSFGGPEGRDDVIPFLERVLRGRNVPRERMLEVAEHYYHFGGVSPIQEHCRDLMAALRVELDAAGIRLPLYWGNRNWHPLIEDTVQQMARDNVRRALCFATAVYSSYSSCRQYLEDIDRAILAAGPSAPRVEKLRPCFNHPGFVAATIDRARAGWEQIPSDRRVRARLIYTAHSIPLSMARTCDYVLQLDELSRLTSEALAIPPEQWNLVYQSRSGRPEDPWLDPDILDHLRALSAEGVRDVVIMPIGFLSDHMEVLYDLDVEAADLCRELNMTLVRAATVGTHQRFVEMIRELIEERLDPTRERRAVGRLPACPAVCPDDCCPAPRRPSASAGRPHG